MLRGVTSAVLLAILVAGLHGQLVTEDCTSVPNSTSPPIIYRDLFQSSKSVCPILAVGAVNPTGTPQYLHMSNATAPAVDMQPNNNDDNHITLHDNNTHGGAAIPQDNVSHAPWTNVACQAQLQPRTIPRLAQAQHALLSWNLTCATCKVTWHPVVGMGNNCTQVCPLLAVGTGDPQPPLNSADTTSHLHVSNATCPALASLDVQPTRRIALNDNINDGGAAISQGDGTNPGSSEVANLTAALAVANLTAPVAVSLAPAGTATLLGPAKLRRPMLRRPDHVLLAPYAVALSLALFPTLSFPLPLAPYAVLVAGLTGALLQQVVLVNHTYTGTAMALHASGTLQQLSTPPPVEDSCINPDTGGRPTAAAVAQVSTTTAAFASVPAPHCHSTCARSQQLLQLLQQVQQQPRQLQCSMHMSPLSGRHVAYCKWVQMYHSSVLQGPWQPRGMGCKRVVHYTQDKGQAYLRPFTTRAMRHVYCRGLPAGTHGVKGQHYSSAPGLCRAAAFQETVLQWCWLGAIIVPVLPMCCCAALVALAALAAWLWVLLLALAVAWSSMQQPLYSPRALAAMAKKHADAKELQAKMKALAADVAAKQKAVDEVKAAASAAKAAAVVSKKQLRSARKAAAAAQKGLADAQAAAATAQAAADVARIKLQQAQAAAATAKAAMVSQRNTTVLQLQDQVQQKDEVLASNQHEMATMRLQLQQLQQQLQATKQDNVRLQKENDNLSGSVGALRTLWDDDRAKLKGLQSQVKGLQSQVASARAAQDAAQATQQAQQADMSALQDQLVEHEHALGGADAQLAACQGQLQFTQAQLTTCQTELQSTQAQLTTCLTEWAASEANARITSFQLASSQKELYLTRRNLAATHKQLHDSEAARAKDNKRQKEVVASVTQAQTIISMLSTEKKTAEYKLVAAQWELDDAHLDIKYYKEEESRLQHKLDQAEAELTKTQGSLDQMTSRCNEQQAELEQLIQIRDNNAAFTAERIKEVQHYLDIAEQDQDKLSSRVTAWREKMTLTSNVLMGALCKKKEECEAAIRDAAHWQDLYQQSQADVEALLKQQSLAAAEVSAWCNQEDNDIRATWNVTPTRTGRPTVQYN